MRAARPAASPRAMQVDITRVEAIASWVNEAQRPATSRFSTFFGHKHPVRDVVAVAAVFQRAVPAFGMVQVDGIAGYGNGVVEVSAGQDILGREDVFPDRDAALADTHERCHPIHPRVFEPRDELPQVFPDSVNLLPGFDLPTGVTPGISRVYAVHTRHVDPYFVLGHARDKDRAGHREVDPRLACLGDLVAKPHGDELLVAERLRRHDVHVIDVRVLCDRVAQALRGDTAHREHQRRGLHAALGIAFAALDAGTEGHVGVARTVDHGAGEDRLAPCLAFDDHPFTSLPSLMTSVQKTYISTSTPASSINCCARVLLSSGSMIVRLT